MTRTLEQTPTDTAAARLKAFLNRNAPNVFTAVTAQAAFWHVDPFDVETIHEQAREMYAHLLERARSTHNPNGGPILVLQGDSGAGKTHLLRAFRVATHNREAGYCGYMQMSVETDNYPRYMLRNLIESLEKPYKDEPNYPTGLARLATGLLDAVPGLTIADREAYRHEEVPVGTAEDYADRLQGLRAYHACDLDTLRVLLYLEQHDVRIRSRVLKWLRCEMMAPHDTRLIGDAIPRPDPADAARTLKHLAQIVAAVHQASLVFLIDQMEEMQSLVNVRERVRQLVDAITAITDPNPNVVVVISCLQDYYQQFKGHLASSKLDRLENDPAPIVLASNRSEADIHAMLATRLAYMFDTANVPCDPINPIAPYHPEHLKPLVNLRTRDVLLTFHQHQERCVLAQTWIEPTTATPEANTATNNNAPPPVQPNIADELAMLWNAFRTKTAMPVPEADDELAIILRRAIMNLNGELPPGLQIGGTVDENYIEVDLQGPNLRHSRFLVAVCNRNARGGGLGKQLDAVAQRMGDFPVVIVRATNFPASPVAEANKRIVQLIQRDGRRVQIADTDWRTMQAFEAFRQQHSQRPDFAQWQRHARPLSELASLQNIVVLPSLDRPMVDPVVPPVTPPPVVPTSVAPSLVVPSGTLLFGRTESIQPTPLTFELREFKQHAAFIGGSGSGKTTAALNLIEQALALNIPAVLIDRKGDLCRYAEAAAWQHPLPNTQRMDQRTALRAKLDVRVYTPGEVGGRPLVLPLVPPNFEQLPEADRSRLAGYAASAMSSMIGFKSSDADKAQRMMLARAIEVYASLPGQRITLPALRQMIEQQDAALLNAIGGGYPAKYYAKLAERLLTLENGTRDLLQGNDILDIDALLGTGPHAVPNRVRLSVISTRFLGDKNRIDFWVAQLLTALNRWCSKSPKDDLQALFLFDEADEYLPAVGKPATKEPMEDLLRRARTAGVGIMLATQSPGDFDYKCRENVRTWVLGRVKETTALKKLKPMLEAAQGDPTKKLPTLEAGHFYVARESQVVQAHSERSLMPTLQMPEHEIAQVARGTLVHAMPTT